MRALEQPLLAVQQVTGGMPALRYRPLMPEDFQALKVRAGRKQRNSACSTYPCTHAADPQHVHACSKQQRCVFFVVMQRRQGTLQSWVVLPALRQHHLKA